MKECCEMGGLKGTGRVGEIGNMKDMEACRKTEGFKDTGLGGMEVFKGMEGSDGMESMEVIEGFCEMGGSRATERVGGMDRFKGVGGGGKIGRCKI